MEMTGSNYKRKRKSASNDAGGFFDVGTL